VELSSAEMVSSHKVLQLEHTHTHPVAASSELELELRRPPRHWCEHLTGTAVLGGKKSGAEPGRHFVGRRAASVDAPCAAGATRTDGVPSRGEVDRGVRVPFTATQSMDDLFHGAPPGPWRESSARI
jgi:hypothetical protein